MHDLPRVIPLFPLPTVVLFPRVHLPLHIFEPRYREMVADALDQHRVVGMVLLRPGWEADYHGRPPIYSIGCAGRIIHSAQHPDGRYNIVLEGFERFRIVREDAERSYRSATVERLPDECALHQRAGLAGFRDRLEQLLLRPGVHEDRPGASDVADQTRLADEDLVNTLAHHLDLDPIEKQWLLEADGPFERCQQLIGLLEFRLLCARRSSSRGIH